MEHLIYLLLPCPERVLSLKGWFTALRVHQELVKQFMLKLKDIMTYIIYSCKSKCTKYLSRPSKYIRNLSNNSSWVSKTVRLCSKTTEDSIWFLKWNVCCCKTKSWIRLISAPATGISQTTPEEGWSRWFCRAKCPHGPHSPDRGLHTDSYQQNFIQEWISHRYTWYFHCGFQERWRIQSGPWKCKISARM